MTKNNRIYLNIFLITLVGLFIRLFDLDKVGGLWNDEYISWFISNRPLCGDFFEQMFKNCHMPLYYFYLKFWTLIFGNSDYFLRVSSVITGALSIPVMFFVGKQLNNEKTGLLCSAMTAVSGFLIYFSQEVRFYSLLFLISALLLLFSLKLIENQSKFNYFMFFALSTLVMLTHTIGFVFVVLNCFGLFWYLKKYDKFSLKAVVPFFIGIFVVMSIFLPFMFKTLTASYISQFWSDFSLTKLFFVFSDYFSPVQINIINTPASLTSLLFKKNGFNFGYFIFGLIPIFISVTAIIFAIKQKNEKINIISLVATVTLFVMVLAAISGKMVLITKYTMEIYPIVIAITAFGLMSVRPHSMQKFLTSTLLGIICFFLLFSDFAPQKLQRSEGHKFVADLIEKAHLGKNDRILLLYYDTNRFGKYIPLEKYNIEFLSKYNFQYMLLHNPPLHTEVIKNGKKTFFPVFASGEDSFFSEVLNTRYFSHLKKGDKFALITLNSVSFIDEEKMKKTVADEKLYKRMPFIFLIFSHVSNIAKKEATAVLKPVFNDKAGNWEIYVFEKQ